MKKFKTTDLIRDLRKIVDANTFHYKSDFNIDAEMFKQAARGEGQYQNWLWISRKCGTNIYPEPLVYTYNSPCYNSALFWLEDGHDGNKTYIVDINPNVVEDKRLEGVIYELSKGKIAEHIKKCAFRQNVNGEIDADALASFLKAEKSRREKLRSASLDKHVEKIKRQNKDTIKNATENPNFYLENQIVNY